MCWLSYCHRKLRMPRCLSSVTARSSFLPRVRIHTFSTPFTGARYPSCLPSGEIWGLARSGLPNKTSRGINGVVNCSWAGRDATRNPTTAKRARARLNVCIGPPDPTVVRRSRCILVPVFIKSGPLIFRRDLSLARHQEFDCLFDFRDRDGLDVGIAQLLIELAQ